MQNTTPNSTQVDPISKEQIDVEASTSPRKRWSWIIFIIIGVMLSQSRKEGGTFAQPFALILPILSGVLFYKILSRVTFIKSSKIRYVFVTVILIVCSIIIQGFAIGADTYSARKVSSEQYVTDYSQRMADFKAKFTDLTERNDALSGMLIDPAISKEDAKSNVTTLTKQKAVLEEIANITPLSIDLMEEGLKAAEANIDLTPFRQQMASTKVARDKYINASIDAYQAQADGKKASEVRSLLTLAEAAKENMEIEEQKGANLMQEILSKQSTSE